MKVRFAGYAAVFDRVDRGGDVIRAGAFADSLRAQGGSVPLLWQHDPGRPAGTLELVAEDDRGLRVIGVGNARVATGIGLSFGYTVRAARSGTYRELNKLDLIEISLVDHPMQPLARVHAVAAVPELTEITQGEDA